MAGAETGYLTRFDGTLYPARITDDFHFSRAASDEAVRTRDAQHQPDGVVYRDLPDVRGHAAQEHTARDVGLGVGAIAAVILFAAGLARWQTRRQRSG